MHAVRLPLCTDLASVPSEYRLAEALEELPFVGVVEGTKGGKRVLFLIAKLPAEHLRG